MKENELIGQIKKNVDLVKHLEMEKNQACLEKEQYAEQKLNSDKKYEAFLNEFNENLYKEKKQIIENVDAQMKEYAANAQTLEEKIFKQENAIDRLTRDKISLISELESYKKKCNSIDLDTHQVFIIIFHLQYCAITNIDVKISQFALYL